MWHRCFPVNFRKFLRTPFLTTTPSVAASGYIQSPDSLDSNNRPKNNDQKIMLKIIDNKGNATEATCYFGNNI